MAEILMKDNIMFVFRGLLWPTCLVTEMILMQKYVQWVNSYFTKMNSNIKIEII